MEEISRKKLEELKKSPWSFFIRKKPISTLVILALIISGIYSYTSLPKEIQPEINIPVAIVSTALPGANPIDVESLITDPLEERIASVSDINSITSTSNFGISSISIEFEADADLDKRVQEVKDAVDLAKSELPDDATDPTTFKVEANDIPIITFSLIGDRPLYELTEIAEIIQDEIESITGVASVDILGGQRKYIEVVLEQKKVEELGLSIQDISNTIRFNNQSLPIGVVQIDKLNYSVRVDNQYSSLEEIRNLPISFIENTPIYLSDVAKVEEAYPNQSQISKFSINGNKSEKSVSLRVNKKKGASVIAIADESKLKVEELQENTIPNDIDIAISNDNSSFIRTDLGILTENGIQTTILIIIILFLAIGFKEGLIAGLSIPLTFFFTFTIMKIVGMTINSLSLFSLVIALGLLVDTAIVIMEGIDENMKEGYNGKDAAILSIHTYKLPLIAGTMTTIFAFFPMLLVSGILGEFLKALPITISSALMASLFVSLTLNPAVASRFLKVKPGKEKTSILTPFFKFLGRFFHKIIGTIINRRIFRALVILIAIGSLALSFMLPISGNLKVEMFPVTDENYFIINIETPKGIIIEETTEVTNEIEEILYQIPEVENFLTVIGTNQSSASTDIEPQAGSTSSNLANITVNLYEKEERERKSYEIVETLREDLKQYTNAKITITEISGGPPSEDPITIRIIGEDLDKLQEITRDIEELVRSTPKTQNVNTSLTDGLNEFKYTLDKNKLSLHGLSANQVSSAIRNIVQGVESTEIKLGDEDLDLFVLYDLPKENNQTILSISDIENFKIQSPKGYSVTLAELGDFNLEQSLASINREEQKRIFKVTSNVTSTGNPIEITQQLEEELSDYEIPQGYEIKFGGDLEDINRSFQELFVSMIIGVILIMFTLVLMFNSFRQAYIILFTLPLALIGVFPGLYAIGLNLSFPAFLGVVALAGIVVNDAIVLIDRINTNRKDGMEFKESIAEAANARLQPIVMTTITTIVGILPLALTNEFWAGLGFSLVFGLLAATMLTLIVIPVLYYLMEGRKEKKRLKKLQELQ